MQNTSDKIQHHELTAEWVDDNRGPAILLSQASMGYDEPSGVLVHPWQLRAVCDQFGLIARDAQAERTIATLTRRLHMLRDRIDFLQDYLVNYSDHKHADLTYEVTYATACIDLADEFCADLTEESPVRATVPECRPAPTPAPAKPSATPSAKPAAVQASLL
jgi:hypothetical protein